MATPYQIPVPEPFSFDARDYKAWLARFERFAVASKFSLTKNDDETLVNLFLYTMGNKSEDIFNSFGLKNAELKSYPIIKKKFEEHFFPKVNVIFERAQFNRRSQEPGETTDSFITDLYKLVETCDYGAKRDELLRDRIVVGLSDLKLSERLQFKSDLTLEKAVEYVRSAEQVKQQAQDIRPKENSVHGVYRQPFRGKPSQRPTSGRPAVPSQHQGHSQRRKNPMQSNRSHA